VPRGLSAPVAVLSVLKEEEKLAPERVTSEAEVGRGRLPVVG